MNIEYYGHYFECPDWVNAVAADKDGMVQGFSHKPVPHAKLNGVWVPAHEKDSRSVKIGKLPFTKDLGWYLLRELKQPVAIDTQPLYLVKVVKMKESHRDTWVVHLTNVVTRATVRDPSMFDKTGIITPYQSEIEEQAVHTAKEWAVFLDVPDQITCTCVMCQHPIKESK